MEVITIESDAYKKLVAKIDRIAGFVVKAEQSKGNGSDNDIWMDSNEVAELLRVSTRTLQCLRKEEDFSQNPSGLQNFSCTGNMEYLCLEKNRNLTGLFLAY